MPWLFPGAIQPFIPAFRTTLGFPAGFAAVATAVRCVLNFTVVISVPYTVPQAKVSRPERGLQHCRRTIRAPLRSLRWRFERWRRRRKKTNPKLWDTVKKKVTAADKGGKPGQWSARKAQLAVGEYKAEGGGYEGKKSADNHLSQWTHEEWGTKSGKESGKTGERYLPKAARENPD